MSIYKPFFSFFLTGDIQYVSALGLRQVSRQLKDFRMVVNHATETQVNCKVRQARLAICDQITYNHFIRSEVGVHIGVSNEQASQKEKEQECSPGAS